MLLITNNLDKTNKMELINITLEFCSDNLFDIPINRDFSDTNCAQDTTP
jgi:hypothetical protein